MSRRRCASGIKARGRAFVVIAVLDVLASVLVYGSAEASSSPESLGAPTNTSTAAAEPEDSGESADTRAGEVDGDGLDTRRLLSMGLEELLDINVSGASKEEEAVSEAPSSVTVFTRKDIARMGIRTVEALLNFVPGFQGTTDNGNGLFRFSARGRSTTPHEYVLVLVDGLPVNELYSGGAMNPIPTENIEQIEFIRGPGSALYGANAFLGVINIKTDHERSQVTAGAGNLNSRYFTGSFAAQLGELQASVFTRFYSDEGFPHRDIIDISGQSATAMDPTQTIDGYLTLSYKAFDLHVYYLDRRFSGISCCAAYSKYSDRAERSRASAQLTYRADLMEDVDVQASASVSRDRSLAVAAVLPIGEVPDVKSETTLEETYFAGTRTSGYTASGNVELRWRPPAIGDIRGTVTGGGSYTYQRLTENLDISSHDPMWMYQGDLEDIRRPPLSRYVIAGFLQTRLVFSSWLHAIAGARYDYYKDFGSSLSPRAAIVCVTPLKSTMKLMYGHAFRAPSFGEVSNRSIFPGSYDRVQLAAETVDTIEAAYTQKMADYATAGLTFFRNKLSNIIEPPQNGLPYRNLGVSTMYGLEAEFRTRDIEGFSLLGSYTHLFPSQAERERLLVPVNFGAVSAVYAWNRLTLNLGAVFRGPSKVGGYVAASVAGLKFLTHEQPMYALARANLQVRILPPLEAFFLLENAFDHQYARAQDPNPSPGVLMRGRTFLLGLNVNLELL